MPDENVALCACGCGLPAPISDRTNKTLGYVKGQPHRFRIRHFLPEAYSTEQRRSAGGHLGFEDYDEVEMGYVSACWIYRKRPTSRGYAQMKMPDGRQPLAHRMFYEHHVGPIPDGLTIDHLCKITRCVNPAHLEPVTQQVNTLRGDGPSAINARKTHCPKGHEYTPENTYAVKTGGRACKACSRERYAQKKARAK